MRAFAVIFGLVCGSAAQACPAGMETLVRCQIAGQSDVLEACFSRSEASYSFGPRGAPDLALRVTIGQVDLDPWPGVGRVRTQGITFYNGGYAYEVTTIQDRFADGPGAVEGGVVVRQGNRILANLSCGPIEALGFLEQTHPYRF